MSKTKQVEKSSTQTSAFKLTNSDLILFKNAANISKGLLIKAGSDRIVCKNVSVTSPTASLLMNGRLSAPVTTAIAIADTSKFLSVLESFDEPVMDITPAFIKVSGKSGGSYRFMTCGQAAIEPYICKNDELVIDGYDCTVEISKEELSQIISASRISDLKALMFNSDGNNVSAIAIVDTSIAEIDQKRIEESDQFELPLTMLSNETNNKFKKSVRISDLKMIPGNYQVYISAENEIVKFVGDLATYWVQTQD